MLQKETEVTSMKTMNRFRVGMMIFCLSLVAPTFLRSAKADDRNKVTKVAFGVPVEVPGSGAQVLPAGTYVFKIADSRSDSHVVQIFSEDQKHVFTTILSKSQHRFRPTNNTVMTLKQRAPGQPEAITAWFYPGDELGHQFVYPEARAIELAKVINQPVLATPLETKSTVTALKQLPFAANRLTGERVQ
jgi:hypothetical protein